MAQLFKNNAFSSMGATLTNVATTLTVASSHGDRFPVVAAPDFMMVTLQDASNNIEIVKVTARASGADTMTIQRAQEGTTARSWAIGDLVELRLTALALNPLALLEGSSTAAAIRTILAAAGTGTANTFTEPQYINANSSTDALKITQAGSGNALYIEDVAADATPLVVSSTGVLGIGTTTPDNVTSAGIALVSNDGFMPQVVNRNKAADANAGYQVFDKDRNGSIVQSGDIIGNIVFRGYDGAAYHQAASIVASVNGTPGTNDMPGKMAFLTTADGASSPTERMAITSAGRIQVTGSQDCNIVAMAALDIDCSAGNYFTKTINGASTFTVSNVPASRAFAFTLELTHTSGAVTWFAGIEWPGGTAPSLTTGKTHLFTFVTDDGGTRWRGVPNVNYTN